jgi:LacI family transcriptional regulator
MVVRQRIECPDHCYHQLRREILLVANRKVTIHDVAKQADVSIASVSLYLNEKPGLADATRDRIAEAIMTLGYVPRQSSSVNDPRFIGLMIEKLPLSPFSDMFYGEIIQAIETHATEVGYHIALIVVEPEQAVPRLLEEHNGDLAGVVMLGSGDINKKIIRAVLKKKLPMILVDNYVLDEPIEAVLPDYIAGANEATKYLLQAGYRRIAFLQGSSQYRSLVERFRGYCTGLIESDMRVEPELIQPYLSRGVPNKGYLEMKALLESGTQFDAVFCVSDRTAFGALQALQEAGLQVPSDVAVVGFDNVAQSSHTIPALTTLNVPKHAIGKFAINRLCEIIGGQPMDFPIKHMLYTPLVIRESA